jgi:lycopene cyclase domain-containing protein
MIQHGLYLIGLLVALAGLTLTDYRYKLAYFTAPKRTLKTIGAATAVFLVWDLLGVGLGIFFIGQTKYLTGIHMLPEVPLEEVFFLLVFVYSALLLLRGSEKLWPRT